MAVAKIQGGNNLPEKSSRLLRNKHQLILHPRWLPKEFRLFEFFRTTACIFFK